MTTFNYTVQVPLSYVLIFIPVDLRLHYGCHADSNSILIFEQLTILKGIYISENYE